jgi:hypothetical protein
MLKCKSTQLGFIHRVSYKEPSDGWGAHLGVVHTFGFILDPILTFERLAWTIGHMSPIVDLLSHLVVLLFDFGQNF